MTVSAVLKAPILETLFHHQVLDRFFDTHDPFGQAEVIVRYRGGRLRRQFGGGGL